METSHLAVNKSWVGVVKLALAIGIAYFLAGWLGLTLRAEPGVAVFWPAAGIAVGALIALGPRARLPIAAAVVVATIACSLMIGNRASLAIAFASINAGQTLFTAWLVERWFGSTFKLEDVQRVLGFLGASALGSAIAAVGATIAVSLINPTAASPLNVWRLWFAAKSLGIVTVAPMMIGLRDFMHERVPRRELIEGWAGVATLAALSALLIALPDGPWATALPETLVFPFLLWFAIRCRPVFAAAAAFVVGLTVIGSTTLDIGHFDTAKPLAERIVGAQTFVLAAAILAVLLAALFAERRRNEVALKDSNDRLQLALDGARLGVWSIDQITGRFENDARDRQIHGYHRETPPKTLAEARTFIHPDDLQALNTAFATSARTGGSYMTEYRLAPRPCHKNAEEERWVAVEGTVVRGSDGRTLRFLGVTRDITERKKAEKALAELNVQRTLAGKAGLVGSYAYDVDTEIMQISPGYAAIQGFPEGTAEITRSAWLAGVHPDDVERMDVLRSQTFRERRGECNTEYRISRSDGEIRWIESRSFISYDGDGRPRRVIGVNIDVTERKQTEALLSESKARLADAMAAGQVMAFEWDAVTGQSRRDDNAVQILGFEQGGTTSSSRYDFLRHVHPDDQARLKARIRELQPSNPSYALSFRFVRPSGKQAWLEETAKGEFDATGRLVCIKGLTKDITERKVAEEALRNQEKAFRRLLEALPAAIHTTDTAGRITFCNKAAIDLWGVNPELHKDKCSDIGRLYYPDGTLMPVDLCPTKLCLMERRAVQGQEALFERPDGKLIPIIPYPVPLTDAKGEVVGVVSMKIDITERKKAEIALAERNAQLALASTAALVGSHTYDFHTGVTVLSPGSAAIYGLPEGIAELSRDESRARVHPSDLERLETEFLGASAAQRREFVSEFRIVRLDNSEVRWIDARNIISYDHTGRPLRLTGVSIDVTERRQSEEHKALLIAELDHRVKNVLATVSAVAGQTLETSSSMSDFVAALDGRIRSMATAHELLSTRQWRGMPMAELVQREFAAYAGSNNTIIDGPEVMLSADAGPVMAMVIHELVTNAAKHGALSTRSGHVSVRWYRKLNGSAQLVVIWQETGGPKVESPTKSGYGTGVVRDLIPYEFGGTVDFSFASEGVRCRLEIPFDRVSSDYRNSSGRKDCTIPSRLQLS